MTRQKRVRERAEAEARAEAVEEDDRRRFRAAPQVLGRHRRSHRCDSF
jgi:hypothetical protein